MAQGHIAIVGMDQVGISLALAVKRGVPDAPLAVIDPEKRRLKEAGRFGKFEHSEANVAAGCRGAALAILNLLPSQLREAFTLIGPVLAEDAVILDLAAVKAKVQQWADELLPGTVHYMGCHLILHPAALQQNEPNADLFQGAVLCMTPTARTDQSIVKIGGDLARALGARPYFLDVAEHDGMSASVEGMPGLISAAATLTIMQSKAWAELSIVAGSIFDQTGRLMNDPALDAGTSLVLNRVEVLRWLDAFQMTLKNVRRLIDEGSADQLNEIFAEAEQKRNEWLASKPMIAWTDEAGLPPSNMPYQRPNPLLPHWGVKT